MKMTGKALEVMKRNLKLISAPQTKPVAKMRGLGDLVEKIVKPFAKAFKNPCVEKESGRLKTGSPCQKRRDKLNEAVPFR